MKNKTQTDVIVIGAGIAGSSVASELSLDASVILLEAEGQPGYHTTGRSAAIFAPIYGPKPIRVLTRASEIFFKEPPDGFTPQALLSARGILMLAREDQEFSLQTLQGELSAEGSIHELDARQLMEIQPLLRDNYATTGLLDPSGQDIDVHALHQGYLRQFKANSGELISDAEASTLRRVGRKWEFHTPVGQFEAPIVVNAAGAWADKVGALAGAEIIGLVPKRRSALIVDAPAEIVTEQLPLTLDIDEQFYLKPEASRLLISPANEDPEEPCDVQATEMDVALCVDRIERAFKIQVRNIESRWAGLRSFVADKSPVAGFSNKVEGFYWLAGQGGYGIQSAPALSRFAASQILNKELPRNIVAAGFDSTSVSPARLQ